MNALNWRVAMGLVLVVLSAVVYFIHFLIFRDAHHIFIYLVADIAFVFIEVLLVTLIIDQLLHQREKKSFLHKLNMIIGIFFSELGNELLKKLSSFDVEPERIRNEFIVTDKWSREDFRTLAKRIRGYTYRMDSRRGDMEDLKNFLSERRDFTLRLLENPNLIEHDNFSDALWAVLHLSEELASRKSLQNLPKTDYGHLGVDMRRAYERVISEWLNYMWHLKQHYPYLFSLAMRTNPFDPKAEPEVHEEATHAA